MLSQVYPILTFHVQKRRSILDGITLYERPPKSVVSLMQHSSLLQAITDKRHPGSFYTHEKDQLKKYAEKRLDDGRIPVTYRRKGSSDECSFGRVTPLWSLGNISLRRQIRHTFCEKDMNDFDIVTAWTTFLSQICHTEGESCVILDEYNENRPKYLAAVQEIYGCSRDDAKQLFLQYLFSGGFASWKSKHNISSEAHEIEFCRDFRKDVRRLMKIVCEKNPEVVEFVKEYKTKKGERETEFDENGNMILIEGVKTYNLNASVCSYVLQEYESRCLEAMYITAKENGWIDQDQICSLCHDGIQLVNKHDPSIIIPAFERAILEKVGFRVKFTCKPFDQGYSLEEIKKSLTFSKNELLPTTNSLAKLFATYFGDVFIRRDKRTLQFQGVTWKVIDDESLHFFVKTKFRGIIWPQMECLIADEKRKLAALDATNPPPSPDALAEMKKPIELEIAALEKNRSQTLLIFDDYKKRQNLVNDIHTSIKNDHAKFDADPYLFAFENCIFDLRNCEKVDPRPDHYITFTCGYNYDADYPATRVAKMRDLIFSILPQRDVRDYSLTHYSTSLCGEQIEYLLMATGCGGNGKSLLHFLIARAMGGYAYELPISVMQSPIKTGANPEAAGMHKKRFVYNSEPDANFSLCSSAMKAIVGNRNLAVREGYSNKVGIEMCNTTVMDCNDLPSLEAVDRAEIRRIRAVYFGVQFLEQHEYDALTGDKTGYGVRNPEYKTDAFMDQHRQAVFEVLLPYWKSFYANKCILPEPPREITKHTEKYLMDNDPILALVQQELVKTNNDIDYVFCKNLYEKMTTGSLWENMTKKQKRDLKQSTFYEKLKTNVFLKGSFRDRQKCKIDGVQNTKPLLIGYRFRGDIEEDIDEIEEEPAPEVTTSVVTDEIIQSSDSRKRAPAAAVDDQRPCKR